MRYYYLEGVEPLGEYEPGGYHPLMPDDLLCDGRYRIVHKLGYGGYSVIWLARDQKEDKYVALKIYKAHGTAHVRREVRALRELRDSKTVPKILDEFSVIGINGTHACYTMEVAAGSLASARYNDVFPIKTARALSAKLALIMLSFHSKGYCHGDVRAANILAKLDRNIDDFDVEQFKEKISSPKLKPVRRFDEEALTPHVPPEAFPPLRLFSKTVDQLTSDDARNILLADLGQVFRPEIEPIEPVRGKECYVPLSERAPEALFRPDDFISYPSDIWSLACTIWDILGATSLFIGADQDVLFADQLVALGPDKLPEAWRKEWESEGPDNKPTANDEVRPPRRYRREGTYTMLPLEPRFEDDVQYWRRRAERALFDEDEKKAILDLMRGMLAFDPKCRYTIADVLESEWMIHWALPALNE